MVRVFLGIPFFNHPVLCAGQEKMKRALAGSSVKWVAPANFHLTLKFIGECEAYYLNAISLIMRETARSFPPLELELTRPGYFGPSKHPTVLWYGVQENSRLNVIRQAIDKGLETLGIAREEKKFHAHITLGRVKSWQEVQAFSPFMRESKPSEHARVSASQFHLFRSDLKPEGPEYRIIESFRFEGQD